MSDLTPLYDGTRDSSATGNGRPGTVSGVVPAVVTANVDPEGLGRVKVRAPSFGSEVEIGWARVATLMAGEGRGTYFLPEVGDEVLLAFEHGDIDYPYVLGSLWSSVDEPPESNGSGDNSRRIIHSREGHRLSFLDSASEGDGIVLRTKGGNQVVLNDAPGGKGITISTAAGHRIRLDDDDGEVVVEDSYGNEIRARRGRLSVTGAGRVEVRADRIRMSAGQIEITADNALVLKGGIVRIN